jgi:predicted  nucleic acid-binding Zn-ribbon protein
VLQNRRAELEAEVRRLQKENQAQTERIQQLERTLRILETRLGGAK